MDAPAIGQCDAQSAGPANLLFGFVLQTLLTAQCTISPPDMWPKDYGPTALAQGLEEYDFVIVGAGSAGSVVASRLSENPDWKVLLLEAGGDPPIESEIPFMFLSLLRTPFDWGYYAQSRKRRACRAFPNGCYWPRGKLLGGSGAINTMAYVRGNARDYDEWEARGNVGWGWQNVLQYFRKSEDNQDPRVVKDGMYHGTGGYLSVVTSTGDSDGVKQMLGATHEAGFKRLLDFNADKHIGFGRMQHTIVNGTRCSPAKAFLLPAMQRPNLQIIKNALVTKIKFNGEKRVTSVKFTVNNGEPQRVKIRKEAIVSAGSINTPQLLMLSGIGRDKDLHEHNIPVISNLPVGRKLQDHITVPLIYKILLANPVQYSPPKDLFQYFTKRDGLLTQWGLSGFFGFVNTVNRSAPYPNFQYFYGYSSRLAPTFHDFITATGMKESYLSTFAQLNSEVDLLVSLPILLKPKSWGSVRLRSTNPQDKPIIDVGYLYHKDDMRTLIEGIRIQQSIMATKAAESFQPQLVRLDLPECDRESFDSDQYWDCYIRELTLTLYHPVGTAKMGPAGDPDAVVDPRLRVRGVHGLRVIDASVMPDIVSGNTNAPTIMIAEKASDLVKEDHQQQL